MWTRLVLLLTLLVRFDSCQSSNCTQCPVNKTLGPNMGTNLVAESRIETKTGLSSVPNTSDELSRRLKCSEALLAKQKAAQMKVSKTTLAIYGLLILIVGVANVYLCAIIRLEGGLRFLRETRLYHMVVRYTRNGHQHGVEDPNVENVEAEEQSSGVVSIQDSGPRLFELQYRTNN